MPSSSPAAVLPSTGWKSPRGLLRLSVVVAVATIVLKMLAWLLTGTLLRRLKVIAQFVHRLALGDYSQRLPMRDRDELDQLASELAVPLREGRLDPYLYAQFDARLQGMASVQAGCERIAGTPLPFAYTLLLHRCAWLFCVLLPFGLAGALGWAVTEMLKRYKIFAENNVRDLASYNKLARSMGNRCEDGSPMPNMPQIVIIIDELADLMMAAPNEVEDSICRLAQMARAAGMHLIVATQRPSVDVVTGIIKANIPSRIAFAVSSQTDSRTILDMGGAEKLLGKGDMLFFPVGAVKPYRIQGAYVSDKDIEATVEFIKAQSINSENIQPMNEIEISMEKVDEDYGDELFWDAVNVFVDSKKASVSLLQRRLRVGYARAARLVDIMEDRGIVSELDSNKRREILIDKDQLERLQAGNKL